DLQRRAVGCDRRDHRCVLQRDRTAVVGAHEPGVGRRGDGDRRARDLRPGGLRGPRQRGLTPTKTSSPRARERYRFIWIATSYFATPVRLPGVSSVGIALSAASPRL